MTSEEKRNAFKKWQDDLEERLAWRLFNVIEIDTPNQTPEEKYRQAIARPHVGRDSIGQ